MTKVQNITLVVQFAGENGRAESHTVPSTTTISQLTRIILRQDEGKQDEEAAPLGRLLLDGKPLEGSSTLAEAGVKTESILVFESGVSAENMVVLTSACAKEAIAFDKQEKDFMAMISMTAPQIEDVKRVPIDLVLVIDRSGSMGSMMSLVIETIEFVITQLKSEDRLSIVDYDDRISTLVPLTLMDADGKEAALGRARTLTPRGGTNLADGLFRGIQVLKERTGKRNPVSSVLLFTDGQANQGITDQSTIIQNMLNPTFIKNFTVGGSTSSSFRHMGGPRMMQQQRAFTPNASPPRAPSAPSSARRSSSGISGFFSGMFSSSQQQQQQQQPPPSYNSAMAETAKETATTTTSDVAETGADDDDVTVFTFGFGRNHNANLLKGIAEAGHGLYFYIENKDVIGDAFVDCIGGLLSVVAQNLQLTVLPSAGVELVDVMTQYPRKRSSSDQSLTLSIKDLQSEERRDLLCKVVLPKLKAAAEGPVPVLTTTLKYMNVIVSKSHVVSTTASVWRLPPSDTRVKEAKVDLAVDKQLNRVVVAEALSKAASLGDSGKLSEARECILQASACMKASPAYNARSEGGAAEEGYYAELSRQCDATIAGMKDQRMYEAHTSKMMKQSCASHYQQRSAGVSSPSPAMYMNSKKAKMKSSFAMFKK